MKLFANCVQICILLCCSVAVSANQSLVIGYWADATPPFAMREDNELKAGIIKDIGDELSRRLSVSVTYKLLPVKRIERELKSGGIHLDCITSPIWKEDPKAYRWSPTLFQGADRFLVVNKPEANIRSLSDLAGKSVGVYHGYVYHSEIMALFDSGKAKAIVVPGIEKGIELLQVGRIDTLIDFGVLLQHQIKEKQLSNKLMLADKQADSFELMCAYSPKLPIDAAEIDKHFSAMVSEKVIQKILSQYR